MCCDALTKEIVLKTASDIIEFVRPVDGCKEIGCSLSTAYRMIKAGQLPELVPISPNCKAWVRHEFEAAKQRMIERGKRDASDTKAA